MSELGKIDAAWEQMQGESPDEVLIGPAVHMNGTSRNELMAGFLRAITALREAQAAVANINPNGRDFYILANGAFAYAQAQHRRRALALAALTREIERIAESI